MKGLFITFEGTEGSGKSTQVALLAEKLSALGLTVLCLREPGGTPIGEEIRHTLKHSEANHAMTPEAELLLMNASRAQLVREVIRPRLAAGEVVLCDRFYDSTTAYQGYGRELDLKKVSEVIDFAVGKTRPDLTLLLHVPISVSEERRRSRQAMLIEVPQNKSTNPNAALPFSENQRDRMEEADRHFFVRVENGYDAILSAEPERVKILDATQSRDLVTKAVWNHVAPLLEKNQASR
ncbi:MAG: dTMP kinase [Verrucomicrobiota bacterium]